MKEEAKTKQDLLKELKLLQRKVKHLEKAKHKKSSRKTKKINIRSEELVRQSEARLRRAELASKSGNWELHLDSKTIFASEGAEKIYGTGKSPIDYKIIKENSLPEYRPVLDNALKNLIENNQPYNLEYKIRTTGTGEIKYIHSIAEFDKEKNIIFGIIQDITYRKQTEDILRESEERYHSIFENSINAVLLTKPDGSILAANPEACRIFDRTEEELCLLGRESVVDITDPRLYASLEDREREGRFKGELTLLRKDGTKFPALLATNVFRDKEGKKQTSMVITDITDQKRIEKELHQLNRQLRAIGNCNQILLRADNEQTLLDEICRIICDDAGYRMAWVGYVEHDEAKSLRPVAWAGSDSGGYVSNARITWTEDSERGQGPAGKTIRSGEITYFQDITTDPQMAPWRENALQCGYRSIITLPLKDEKLKVFGVLLIYSSEPDAITPDEIRLLDELTGDLAFGIIALRNRNERKLAEEALYESEERFRKIFEDHSAVKLLIDLANGNIVEANKAAVEYYGWTKEELLRMNIAEINILPAEEIKIEMERAARQTEKHFEFRHRLRNGTIRDVDIFSGKVELSGKEYLHSIVQDITDRKLAEKKLENYSQKLKELNERKDKLFSIIAHDLRSPFAPLLGLSEFLVNEFDSLRTEEIKDYNKEIYISLKNEYTLLENLLNWSRLETKQIEFEPERINLYDKTEDVINLLLGNAKLKDIALFNGIERDIFISADPNMLNSVLQNLISNSIKFTNNGGLIKIYSQKDISNFIKITVSDNGVGMTSDQTKDLFSLSAKSTIGTKNEKGTGLGLMICKEMIERHGGTISLKSEAGKGTDISFTLLKAD
jgi:PAS domain S-box-containing protein